jgi:hypothetical protein
MSSVIYGNTDTDDKQLQHQFRERERITNVKQKPSYYSSNRAYPVTSFTYSVPSKELSFDPKRTHMFKHVTHSKKQWQQEP